MRVFGGKPSRQALSCHWLFLSLCILEVVTHRAAGPQGTAASPGGAFPLRDMGCVNSLVALGPPGSARQQPRGEEARLSRDWAVGRIQRGVFAERRESSPPGPTCWLSSRLSNSKSPLACRGQTGICLSAQQASGVAAHSRGQRVAKGVLEACCQAAPALGASDSCLSHLAFQQQGVGSWV